MDVNQQQGGKLPTLAGPRVKLRSLIEEDAADLFDIFSNQEVVRYWSSPAQTDIEQSTKLIQQVHSMYRDGTLYEWGITQPKSNRVLGTVTLSTIDRGNRRAEVGFALNRDFWGQGIALDAVTLMIEYAFSEMRLHRLEADVDPRNSTSIALLEKLQFRKEGLLRERWIVNDEVCDTVFMGLLASDWRADNSTVT